MTKTTILGLGLAALLLGLPQATHAQITVTGGLGINIAFPEPPPLVVVRPGIQIVPEYDEEVYFTGGYYWVHRDDSWYRCRDWHGREWRPVHYRYVPTGLARIPPGRFRHYYRDDDGRWRPHHDEEWREWRGRNEEGQRRAWWRDHVRDRQVRMEQERAWRDRQREDREMERAHWRQVQNERRERERAEFERRREERHDRHDRGGPPPGHEGPPRGHDRDRHDGGPGPRHHG